MDKAGPSTAAPSTGDKKCHHYFDIEYYEDKAQDSMLPESKATRDWVLKYTQKALATKWRKTREDSLDLEKVVEGYVKCDACNHCVLLEGDEWAAIEDGVNDWKEHEDGYTCPHCKGDEVRPDVSYPAVLKHRQLADNEHWITLEHLQQLRDNPATRFRVFGMHVHVYVEEKE